MDTLLRKVVRIGIPLGDSYAMGPGKADLLDAIHATGSISAAGRKLGMSYRRAWLLVDEMNRCFRAPLVEARLGGSGGGGWALKRCGATGNSRTRPGSRCARPCTSTSICCSRPETGTDLLGSVAE